MDKELAKMHAAADYDYSVLMSLEKQKHYFKNKLDKIQVVLDKLHKREIDDFKATDRIESIMKDES